MNKVARSNRGKAVLGVQLGHGRAWQRRSGLTGNAFKRLGLGQSASNQRLLAQLEVENVQLRGSLVDLMLEIQALHDELGHPQSETRPKTVRSITWLPTTVPVDTALFSHSRPQLLAKIGLAPCKQSRL